MPTSAAALETAVRDACRADLIAVRRVERADGAIRVTFRYRADPAHYTVDLAETSSDDARAWAAALRSRLVTAIDDGWVSRARRTRTESGVTLSTTDCATVVPPGYQLGEVAVRSTDGHGRADAGWWLATEGFTVAPLQRSAALGRVVAWVAGSAATELAAPTLAHAAVVTDDDGAAVLLVVEARPHVPASLATSCAYRALRSAAEGGIESVRSRLDAPALAPLGLRASAGRPAQILLVDLPVPDLTV